jgi:hypothetical protein
MREVMISIANDFSRFPAGRFYTDGPNSGQRFLEELLYPALSSNSKVVIDLDGASGYGSSFLDEAFGGLIRTHHMNINDLKNRLEIRSSIETYKMRIWKYIQESKPQ